MDNSASMFTVLCDEARVLKRYSTLPQNQRSLEIRNPVKKHGETLFFAWFARSVSTAFPHRVVLHRNRALNQSEHIIPEPVHPVRHEFGPHDAVSGSCQPQVYCTQKASAKETCTASSANRCSTPLTDLYLKMGGR